MKKRFVPVLCAVMTALLSAGCQRETPSEPEVTEEPVQESQAVQPETAEESAMDELCLKIGEEVLEVRWEDNESVEFLKEAVKDEPLTVELSMYGGFEQVGSLGMSVPRNDSDTVTQSGDIVLYSGNQIVVFYGSNSWAYTRLGHIENKSQSELRDLLGNGDVTLTLFNGASASFSVPDVTLNSGYTMPVLGLGTWTLNDAEAENSVYHALKSGMRLIDTARYYRCETGVGNGIRKAIGEGFVTREEIFVTSKIMPSDYDRAYQGIHDSLKDLGLGVH
jgi:hypothetical protein